MAEAESQYGESFNLDQPLTTTLFSAHGPITVTNDLANVDLWTLPRIINAIEWLI
jgi:hypothetical protein